MQIATDCEPLLHDGPIKPDAQTVLLNKAMDLLREATAANKHDDNVLLSPDWFRRAKELCQTS